MRSLFSLALSAGSSAVLIVILTRRHDAVSSLGGLTGAVPVLVLALGGNAASLLLPAKSATLLGVVACLFYASVIASARLGDVPGGADRARRTAWKMIGLLLAWCITIDVVLGLAIAEGRVLSYAAVFVVWLGAGLLAGRVSISMVSVAWTGSLLLALLSLPAVAVESFWSQCHTGDLDKCSAAGALFTSFARSENYLAILCGFTAVCALIGMRGFARLVVVGHSVLVLIATGSRTGMLALGIAVIVVVAGSVIERRHSVKALSLPVCLVASFAACSTAAIVVAAATPDTFSRRGAIWIAVRHHLEGFEATGVGVSTWAALQSVGQSPHHFFHSGYALILFSGGLVGLGFLGLVAGALLRRSSPPGTAITDSAPVVLLLVYSFTEVVWNPLAVDGLTWILVLLLCASSPALRPSSSEMRWRTDAHP